jgi:hypothetical protein
MASVTRCLVCLTLIALVGCSGEDGRKTPEAARSPTLEIGGVTLVRPEQEVRDQCRSLAERVGYPLPCPRLLPQYSTPYWGRPTGNSEFFQTSVDHLQRWVWLSVNFVRPSDTADHLAPLCRSDEGGRAASHLHPEALSHSEAGRGWQASLPRAHRTVVLRQPRRKHLPRPHSLGLVRARTYVRCRFPRQRRSNPHARPRHRPEYLPLTVARRRLSASVPAPVALTFNS